MSSVRQRQLKFGAILAGVGTDFSQWRDPELPPNASIDIDWYIHNARLAEEARFDLVFIVDSPFITPDTAPHFLNRLEPLTLLSALAVSTSRIGLVGTLTTTYWEPYNVARLFGSLDHISKGRAGWNVVTTGLEGASRNYGKDKHLDHALRYQRAEEFVDVVKGLWDSYEDDAFPYDRENDVFLDKSKQHALNHKGEFLSVAGPLALSRSPQGYPVIFQAGDSNAGRQLGAQIADGTFAAVEDFESAQEYYHDLKTRAKALGRDPDSIHVLPGIAPSIAETDEEAREIAVEREGGLEIAVEREGGLDIDKKLVALGRAFNYHDFRQYPLDAPFPDISNLTLNSYKGHAERILRGVNAGKLTLRQAAERYGSWRLSFVGSPETVANEIERWFVGNAADGFNIRVTSPRDFKLFRERVIPILQERGLFRTEYEGTTLRDHLGLSVPENRWTARKREESSRADAA